MATVTNPQARELRQIDAALPFPDALRHAEWPDTRSAARVGVGLSGGGIRSATFSLGFFQGLAHWGLLRHIDYLSTVSGGGYFGAFYGHLLHRPAPPPQGAGNAPDADGAVRAAERELTDPASRPLHFLRENGRYLSPNGAGDLLLGAAGAIRGLAAVLIVMGSLALLVVTLIVLGRLTLPAPPFADSFPPLLPWVSPLFIAALVAVGLLAVPVAWAYWLVPPTGRAHTLRELVGQWAAPVAAIGTAGAMLATPFGGDRAQTTVLALGAITALTLGRYLLAWWTSRGAEDGAEGRSSLMRGSLSRGLKRALVVIGVLLLLAVVDSLGAWIAFKVRGGYGGTTVTVYGALTAVGALLRKGVTRLSSSLGSKRGPALPMTLLINVGAVVLGLALLGGLATIPNLLAPSTLRLEILAGALAGLALAIGGVWSFVNHSSLHATYEARLRRAYLGATNPARFGEGENHPPITDPHPNDGLAMADYNPARHGGPVHLINVTVNETVDGRSQVQQRDRKGVGMAVGPGGISVGRTHHATWAPFAPAPSWLQQIGARLGHGGSKAAVAAYGVQPSTSRDRNTFRVFPGRASPEDLDVGQWVAISGAAFSTGLGSRTSLGLSFLAGLFNVRLGYWWWSGVNPDDRVGRPKRTATQEGLGLLRGRLAVQGALLDEWFARFPGVARREWYLSDGGHFENLGGYELIRRRLPFIVLSDNEQDVDYEFQGLGNLVRKARVDFATEITFLSERELTELFGPHAAPGAPADWRTWVGPLEALRRGRRAFDAALDPASGRERIRIEASRSELSSAHAALARVRYPAGGELPESEGWLLYVKPTLVGDEPPDLAHYHGENPDFPHQSTGDQFFDEAQWESYRKLGELIARKLFDGISDRKTTLHQMFRGGPTPEADPSVALPPGSVEWVPMEAKERAR